MKGKFILTMSLFGIAMAFASVYLPSVIEPFCWLIIYILIARQVAIHAPEKPFLNGFMISIVNCIWVTGVRILLLNTYMAHHAKEAIQLHKSEPALTPSTIVLIMSPFIAILSGLVLGVFSSVAVGLTND